MITPGEDAEGKSKPSTRVRVALLTEIISPYRVPFLNALAADPRIDLDVYFFAETERRRAWRVPTGDIRFRYHVLWGVPLRHDDIGGTLFLNPGILWRLLKGRYDCVVMGGYHQPTAWLALGTSTLTRTRRVLWSESTAADLRAGTGVRERLKRTFVRRMDAHAVAGAAQGDYLAQLGAPRARMRTAPDAVDSPRLSALVQDLRKDREAQRKALDISGEAILSVGRMHDFKGVPDLIEAFRAVRLSRPRSTLVLVGDGPERARYERMARDVGIEGISFRGFVSEEDLPRYYACADVFAFPTRSDPWGLVLNEALAAGLPVVVSRAAGASRDLVEEGGNGFLHDPADPASLAGGIVRILEDPARAAMMGKRSLEIVASHSPAKMAEGMADAILLACGPRVKG